MRMISRISKYEQIVFILFQFRLMIDATGWPIFQIKAYYAALSDVWEFESALTIPLAITNKLADNIPSGNCKL